MHNKIKKIKLAKDRKNLRPIVLLILDGWGLAPPSRGNAISLAKTPVIDKLWEKYPHTKLENFGKHVGLPVKQVGNSEAGHMNIGAGRIIEQDSVRISKAINQGTFFKNPAFIKAFDHVKENKSALHLMGMLSDGGSAHADQDHLEALLSLSKVKNIEKIYLHLFTDGRDSSRHAAIKLISKLKICLGNAKISTVMGRFYAMDRMKNWERTKIAYDALVMNRGRQAKNIYLAITESYNRNENDEFIPPYILEGGSSIKENDAVIFFNLRSDRARQLTKAFVQKNFEKMNPGSFRREKFLKNIIFVAMTDFGPDLDQIITAYPGNNLFDTLPMVLSNFRQLYIAETEKYAHVTYFFNGGYPDTVNGEERIRIPSPPVMSYDLTPKMSVGKITSKVINELDNFDFIVINFASPDMVGHTGNLEAGIKAVEYVDSCVGKIKEAVLKRNGALLITSDHGNVDEMINLKTGEISPEHSFNPSPFIFVSREVKGWALDERGGVLADIAPTILDLLCLKKPKIMTGESLLIKSKQKKNC